MRKPSLKSRSQVAVIAANKLALNLVHFLSSGGTGPEVLIDALQGYEIARAAYCDQANGYQYSDAFRAKVHKAAAVLRAAR